MQELLKKLQDENQLTKLMMLQEEYKTLPFGDIWAEYCNRCNVAPDSSWFDVVETYEKEVLLKRD